MSRRETRLALAKKLREAVNATARVKTAFGDAYFKELEAAITEAGEGEEFYDTKHFFFFTFFDSSSVVNDLEQTFNFIEKTFNRNLSVEIKKLAGSHSGVISTVFQFMALYPFVKSGLLKAYEPPADAGSGSKAEALADLAGQSVLVEVQSKMQADLPSSFDENDEAVDKLHGKLMQKCTAGQLAHSRKPAILFQDTDFGFWDHHVDKVIDRVKTDPNCKSASAIVFGWTYTGKNWRIWINPNASHPLSPEAENELKKLFDQ
jgi:hypothetical protein